ncbi:bacterial transcriptional activator domain-containing protein [Nocardioides mangrovicus]|uniref:bacterial transcriptional activator domain-containing protein n=1 Tax=Nocardioides mangrovicus TaxID=2478913 RepID=UPI001313EAC6|nr:bacterial transcriptional activator domain-containing protein [Nocardioides mangrovicus]
MTPPNATKARSRATSTPATRPDMLPRDDSSSERNVLVGAASVVGSLLLLLGVPVALVLLVGNPLPSTAPSRDWLTAQITSDLVINVLAVLVWIVWAHFVACFISEWRALRQGRVPHGVILGGGSQSVARRLVAGILMLSGGLGVVHGVSAAMTTPSATGPTQATTSVSSLTVAGADAAQSRAAAESAVDVGATTPRSGAMKHYEVVPPQGRHHDTLWDISQRLLGDPLRYKEIYDLNKDRMQPDGRRLTDADLIQPGWQLVLPADAKGPGVRLAPQAHTQLSAPDAPATPAAPGSDQASSTQQSDVVTGVESLAGDQDQQGVDLGDLLLGGGLLLAGVLTALTSRRGLFGTPSDTEGALRLAANPVRSDLLDKAMRVLAETRLGQNLPMPDLSVVYLSDDQVVAHVVGSPQAPSHPWRAAEDGGSWSVAAADLADFAGTGPAPYPALVDVAESHGYDVLVDLEYASGLVALGGDLPVAREVAMSAAVDLVTHAWSDSVDVQMVGFGDDLSQVAPERVTLSHSLDEALDAAEERLGLASRLLARLGVDGVLSGRGTARHAELRPQVLVLSGPPSAEQVQRISRLASGGRTAFAAICVGDAPGARWRFVVDGSGHIDLGVLGVRGTARRLTVAAQQELKVLLGDTVKEAGDRAREVAESRPSSFVHKETGELMSAGRTAGTLPGADAEVTVQLLGPVGVTTPSGGQGPTRDVLTELVAMAALHPHGLHEATLRSGLWPRGVGDDVVESTIRDAQIWLGVDATGQPRLAAGDDGLYRLSGDVYVDWNALQLAAIPDGGSEAGSYVRALELAQGAAFSGTPAGRYGWLAWHRAARDARALIVTMAERVTALLGAGDPRRAEAALRNGLRLVPDSEELWRDLMRLKGDGPEGAPTIAAEMFRTLPGHRFEPETEALVAHLAPGVSPEAPAGQAG